MDKVFFIAALVSMGGVVGALIFGVAAMTRGTEKAHKTSNKMMQLRVLFQGLTILFLVLAYLAKG
jgi:hypothetical protein